MAEQYERAGSPVERTTCYVPSSREHRSCWLSQIPEVNLSIHPARAIQPTPVPQLPVYEQPRLLSVNLAKRPIASVTRYWRAVCIYAARNQPDAGRDVAGSGGARIPLALELSVVVDQPCARG